MEMYEKVREYAEQAKAAGLAMVIWSYARGSQLSKKGETAIDVIGYAAHIAAQLGATIIKVKPPTEDIEQAAAKKAIEGAGIPIGTLQERIKHVTDCCFGGRRVVIFSGGAKKDSDADVIDEITAIRDGGGFGSIIGRNCFQRSKKDALELLDKIVKVYGA